MKSLMHASACLVCVLVSQNKAGCICVSGISENNYFTRLRAHNFLFDRKHIIFGVDKVTTLNKFWSINYTDE